MKGQDKILVIDDDKIIRRIVSAYLADEGYEVYGAGNCAYALEVVHKEIPSLIILDVELPDINGVDFCRVLRNDTTSAFTPIIMLTSRNTTADKVIALEAGADDYLTKPFELAELAARVKSHLRRVHQERAFNPLSGLPGNKLIQAKLEALLESKARFTLIYFDINDFKAYNDVYGFVKGDEAIRLLAKVIQANVSKMSLDGGDFIGHIGGDDFVVITVADTEDYASRLCEYITSEFNHSVFDLYNEEDQAQGYIIAHGHSSEDEKYPIMTLSAALLSPEEVLKSESIWELARIAANRKKTVKSALKSGKSQNLKREPLLADKPPS